MPVVYILLLNTNCWRDTIECLESVFRLRYPNFVVLVCDNASTDGSIEQIKAWARGEIVAGVRNPQLGFLTTPAVRKPIPFAELQPDRAGVSTDGSSPRLVLLPTGGNLGFAGGNNVGLRYALADKNCEFSWLLNNDTVVEPGALSALVQRMQQRPDAGICGSTLLYYDRPKMVQALGGSVFHPWIARGGHIGFGQKSDSVPGAETVEKRMKYVMGASMLVRRQFLEEIGLMNDEYFLYFDEIDWATRARGRYALAYAPQSVVYHKEGATIGSSTDRSKRSAASEYYAARSRMLYTKRYVPQAIPLVAAALVAGGLFRYAKGNNAGANAIMRGLYNAIKPR